jgi:hypothetical protein
MDGEEAARAVLGNRHIYLSEALFFGLLQDRGQTMSDKEKAKFDKNKTKAAVKGKVHFEGCCIHLCTGWWKNFIRR